MNVQQVIRLVDDIKPNAFSDEAKTAWLNEAEGLVQTEVLLLAPEEIIVYSWEKDRETELLVKPPHDKLYWAYLTALIDFANGEYLKYQNTVEMFNSHFGEYMRWYASRYRPADGKPTELGYYLTAYGIAVKHGFVGTEEEWLVSLVGPRGPQGEPGPQGEQGLPGTVKFEEMTPEQLGMLRGPEGPVGPQGPAGATGAQGPAGPAGEDGAQGPKGDKGDKGEKGDKGDTGPAGANGAQGPVGPQGPEGPTGPQGEKGETGSGLTILDHYETLDVLEAAVTSPNPGDAYSVGESAPYDIYIYSKTSGWKNHGPIQGAKGDTGEQGPAGPAGPQGETGPGGPQGPEGPQGETGAQGEAGPQGEQGPQGIQGPAGETGATGPEGPQGPQGETGPAGYTPVRGTDYWTADDKAQMVSDVLAALPTWEGGNY